MIDGEFAVTLDSAGAAAEKGLQVGLVTQIIICIILSASLKSMWNFLNVVQVLVYLQFFAMWSGTMEFIFRQMDNAITLKPIIDPMYELGASKFEVINASLSDEGLQNSGVQDAKLAKQLGIFALIFIVILIGILVWFLIKCLNKKTKCCKSLQEKI